MTVAAVTEGERRRRENRVPQGGPVENYPNCAEFLSFVSKKRVLRFPAYPSSNADILLVGFEDGKS